MAVIYACVLVNNEKWWKTAVREREGGRERVSDKQSGLCRGRKAGYIAREKKSRFI